MDPVEYAVSLHEAALQSRDEHRFGDAVPLAREALGMFEKHCGAGDPDVANVLSLLGSAYDELGDHTAAETCHRRAVAVVAALPADGGDLSRLRVQAGTLWGACLRRQGRYRQAGIALRAALDDAGDLSDLDRVAVWNELGILAKFAGRLDEAATWYTSVLTTLEAACGPGDPRLASVYHNLAGLAHSRGDLDAGETWARRSLALHRALYAQESPAVVADEAHLAAILLAQGRHGEAEPLLRHAIEYFTRRFGPSHYEVAVNLHNLAAARAGLGDLTEAESLYRAAVAAKRAGLGPAHPEVALSLNNLAVVVADLGRPDEASMLATEAHRILAQTPAVS